MHKRDNPIKNKNNKVRKINPCTVKDNVHANDNANDKENDNANNNDEIKVSSNNNTPNKLKKEKYE